ncbi:hypothetical protein DL93DRAFT_2074536 [Clavulina sp. PMI_390]|nr:hypothetical protein DL93DRAFT_2074536 [Clavulina sp. PMI_390]
MKCDYELPGRSMSWFRRLTDPFRDGRAWRRHERIEMRKSFPDGEERMTMANL